MNVHEKTNVFIECERLRNFLENNQLVQANAIVQKLEVLLQADVAKDSQETPVEGHPSWQPFRCVIRIKSRVLSGKRDEALAEATNLSKMIAK